MNETTKTDAAAIAGSDMLTAAFHLSDENKILIAKFLGWEYCYENMLVAHGNVSKQTKYLFTRHPLVINELCPNTVSYDYRYGHKCSIPNFEFLYIDSKEGKSSLSIYEHNFKPDECYNQLMQIIDYIENGLQESYTVDIINKNMCEIFASDNEYIAGSGQRTVDQSKIEAISYAVVDFIKWYNNRNAVS